MRINNVVKVDKGWGFELIWASNDNYCGKILQFEEGKEFSMHFHAVKHETWLVVSGEFEVLWINTENAQINSEILKTGDVWENAQFSPHKVKCISAGSIVEISTKDSSQDNYRVAPGDSQK